MAERPSEKNSPTDEKGDPNSDETATRDEQSRSVQRRSFLGLGATVGALGLFGGASVLADTSGNTIDIVEAGADPDGNEPIDGVLESVVTDGAVVEFPSDGEFLMNGTSLNADNFELRGNGTRLYPEGGFVTIEGTGWTMDGFEIDMRSDDTYPSAIFGAADWTVSRCIWRGQAGSAESYAAVPKFEEGTTGRFVDCYWPDGAVDGGEASNFGCFGSFGNNRNGGHLKIERCWFHGWSEDTSYLSEASGSVEIVDCFYHNTIVGPRVSDATLRRVKSVHDGAIPVERWSGSSFQAGVWLNGEKGVSGQPVIEDCDFYIAGPSGAPPVKGDEMPGGTTIRNTRIHCEDLPQAIRLGDNQSVDHDITLDSVTLSGVTETVLDGNVLQNDVSTVSGEATDATPNIPSPPPEGSIPGESSSPDGTDGTDSTSPAPDEWRTIRFEGDGDSSTQAVFELGVSGSLESQTPEEEVQQDGHGVDGSTVVEDVWSGYEEYDFTGDITTLSVDGPATVYIDGKKAKRIRITGDGDSSTQAVFEFEVSGSLDSLTPEEETQQDGHGVDGSTVVEDVWSSYEEYVFTGDITAFDVDGPATVSLNGEQVSATEIVSSDSTSDDSTSDDSTSDDSTSDDSTSDDSTSDETDGTSSDGTDDTTSDGTDDTDSGSTLPHVVEIVGSETEVSKYSFTVSEEVEKHESIGTQDASDTISGNEVSGYVHDDIDAYRFSGSLQSFELTGSATIQLNES